MRTTIKFLALSAAMAGCSSESPPAVGEQGGENGGGGGEEIVSTTLKGRLYFELIAAQPRLVEVYDFAGGVEGSRICRTEPANGDWACNLGPISGDVVVKANITGHPPLTALVTGLQLDEVRDNVQVSPVTHLTYSYAQFLMGQGSDPGLAVSRARNLVHGHFAGVDYSRVQPEDMYTTQTQTMLEQVVSGVLFVSLGELAGQISDENGTPRQGVINTWKLVAALYADVRQDGLFDGKGQGGPLSLGSVLLDGSTLRADYARAVLAWLESENNLTVFRPADFEALADRIASNSSPIFPQDVEPPPPVDNVGPTIPRVALFTASGEEVPHGGSVAGVASLHVTAEDLSGVAEINATDAQQPGSVSDNQSSTQGYGLFSVDTRDIEDGAHEIAITAVDTAGNITEVKTSILSDNTPPTLTATAAGLVQSPLIRISGAARDSSGVVSIVIRAGSRRVEIEPEEETFTVELELRCNMTNDVQIVATDAAGNSAEVEITVQCDDNPPYFAWVSTSYDQEGALDAVYSEDGSSVSYVWSRIPDQLTFNGNTVWPQTIEKYFNRLDDWSDNLPVFHFLATDESGYVSVRYRYRLDDTVIRDWTPILSGAEQDRFLLPISYQSLDTSLATGYEYDLHQIDVVATDAAGNTSSFNAEFHMRLLSPPVWFGNCEIPTSLHSYSLGARTLKEIYTVRHDTDVLHGQIRYALDLAPGSLAPRSDSLVQLTGGDTVSRITRVSEDSHVGPQVVPQQIWQYCIPAPAHVFASSMDMIDPYTCIAGGIAADGIVHDIHFDGPVSDDFVHTQALEVERRGLPVFSTALGYEIEPDAVQDLRVGIQNPEIYIGGSVFDWDETISVPSGYIIRAGIPPRYRLPWNRAGFDYVVDPRYPLGDVYPFVTRGYISGFEIEVAELQLGASHESLLNVPVDIQVSPSCIGAMFYSSDL